MIKISELRLHDVINVIDGRRLGMIRDIDIDVETGRVRSIILPGNNRVFNFFAKSEEVIIPWEKIVKIGVDVILVEYSATNQLQQK
ncbi:MAG: YlmC/YmxH family sporulation protein [Thermacetogeniaceae bacterium]|nr:YlmC/YmxH family sporulation protein [Thermoanaerobacterales bacterium]NLN22137.1 YlmC/YmxH family sporulation protein [Syntrophomonadaceae bacterium]HAF17376.1 YlmC/YmxH family sporulation protein [Peptococcaceae bacterium]